MVLAASPAMMSGLTSVEAGGGRRGGGRGRVRARRVAGGGLKVTPSNKRMHATRDTHDFMFLQRLGRARDARR